MVLLTYRFANLGHCCAGTPPGIPLGANTPTSINAGTVEVSAAVTLLSARLKSAPAGWVGSCGLQTASATTA